jgi:CubicO group peptidase (beta-lactamase class C family)
VRHRISGSGSRFCFAGSLLIGLLGSGCSSSPSPPARPLPPPTHRAVDPTIATASKATVGPRAQRFVEANASSAWTFPDATKRRDRGARLAAKLAAQLDAEHDRVATGTGFAFALVIDGEVVLLKAKGIADLENKRVATPDTIYRIASLTKTFTASAVMALRDDGKLATSDTLATHLPELDVQYPHHDDAPIRIEQVLTHSAGLARSGPYAALPRASTEADLTLAMKLPLTVDPGLGHRYSNFGFGVLGLLVGRKAGSPYRDFIQARLLQPLKMTSSGFDVTTLAPENLAVSYKRDGSAWPPVVNGAGEAAGGLYSSARDMAEWIRFQLAAWPPRNDPDDAPLKRATLREMHTPRLGVAVVQDASSAAPATRAHAISVGLAWEVTRGCYFDRLVGHDGDLDGFHARLRFDADRSFGFVLLGNSDAADLSGVTDRLLDTIATEDLLAPRRRDPAAALVEATERAVKRIGASWTEEDHAQTFSETFRTQLGVPEALALGARIAKEVGVCSYVRAESVTDALEAELVFQCTRGMLRASVRGSGTPLRLLGFKVDVMTPASEEQLGVASELVARMRSRDDAALAKTLRTKAIASASKMLLRAGAEAGSCKVEGGDVSPWTNAATFRLTCAKTRASLRLHQRSSGAIEVAAIDVPTRCLR